MSKNYFSSYALRLKLRDLRSKNYLVFDSCWKISKWKNDLMKLENVLLEHFQYKIAFDFELKAKLWILSKVKFTQSSLFIYFLFIYAYP